MTTGRRPGYAGVALLKALKSGARYGLDLMEATELPSGTVYPQMRRLEQRGFVRSAWEAGDAAREHGRPRRRYYEITPEGEIALAEAIAQFVSLTAPAAPQVRRPAVRDA